MFKMIFECTLIIDFVAVFLQCSKTVILQHLALVLVI